MVKIKLRRKRSSKSSRCTCFTAVVLATSTVSMLFILKSTYNNSISRNSGAAPPPLSIDQILKDSRASMSKVRYSSVVDGEPRKRYDEFSKSIQLSNDERSKTEIVLKREGTGPTEVGYVKDFQTERHHHMDTGSFDQTFEGSEKVPTVIAETTMKPCSTWKNGRQYTEPHCSDPTAVLYLYNAAWFPRFLCGQEVQPDGFLRVEENCEDYETGFSTVANPPVSGDGMQPIVIKSRRDDIANSGDLDPVDCDIPCVQEKDMQGIRRFVQGEQWTITFTDADAFSNGNARLERLGYREDHFFSTQSFKSVVPHTFFNWSQYSHLNKVAVDWLSAKKKAVYLVDKSCSTPGSRRHKYFDAIAAVVPVDAYGSCGHNIQVPEGISIDTSEGRIEIMQKYRVVLAFDASTDKDHISPMIWDALASGSVPVVVGAENMRSHLPEDSFVWSGDFSNWDDLAAHVKKLLENKSLWESYQAWRNDENTMSRFRDRYEFAKTSAICRLCRWSYAKKFGLGFDDERQEVSEPIFARRLCLSEPRGIISKPFQEAWISKNDKIHEEVAAETCGPTKVESLLESNGLRVNRTVSMHDGVIDIELRRVFQTAKSEPVVLKLNFPGINNIGGAHFQHTHKLVPISPIHISSASMQDASAKVTVLSNWETDIASPSTGVIEVVVTEESQPLTEGDVKRIRIVLEDFDDKNEKTTEFFPSAFCKKVIKDFADPVQLLYVDS